MVGTTLYGWFSADVCRVHCVPVGKLYEQDCPYLVMGVFDKNRFACGTRYGIGVDA